MKEGELLLGGHLHHLCVGVGLAEGIRILRGYGLPAGVEQEAAHVHEGGVNLAGGPGGQAGSGQEGRQGQARRAEEHSVIE